MDVLSPAEESNLHARATHQETRPGAANVPLALESRRWSYAFLVIWLTALVIALATFLDYGLTWDENLLPRYGDAIFRWFATFGRDREALGLLNLYLYGGLFEVCAQAVGRWFPAGVFEGRHLVNVLFGLAGVLGTYQLGTTVGGARVGCLAAVGLLANPLYYGHSFNNPKDIPFAALSVWALAATIKGFDGRIFSSWRPVIATGIAVGLALGVRSGGVFLLGYVALFWSLTWLRRFLAAPQDARVLRDLTRLVLSLLVVMVIAWILMIACWPYGQLKPIANPINAIRSAVHFDDYASEVLFRGSMVPSSALPWTYLPVYFAMSLPESLLLGLAVGCVVMLWAVWHRSQTGDPGWNGETAWKVGFLIFAVVFPVATAIVMGSMLYDGLRHFLFLMPVLAVLSAAGYAAAWDALPRGAGRMALASAASGLLAWVVLDMVRLHPYQSVYYNRLIAGGVKGAAGRFEADYWGASYLEATRWVLANYRPQFSGPVRVANCSDNFMTEYYLRQQSDTGPRFETSLSRDAHIVLATTRYDCHRREWGRVLHIVERQGVGLAYVFERTPPS